MIFSKYFKVKVFEASHEAIALLGMPLPVGRNDNFLVVQSRSAFYMYIRKKYFDSLLKIKKIVALCILDHIFCQ